MTPNRLNGVATRQLSIGGYTGPERRRHGASIDESAPSTEVDRAVDPPSIAVNSHDPRLTAHDLEAAYARAIDAAGLDDKGFAAIAGISPAQLSRQLRGEQGNHLSVQRLAHLPVDGQVAFVEALARRLGLDVVRPAAELLVVGELMDVCLRAMRHMRMVRMDLNPRRAAVADRRVG